MSTGVKIDKYMRMKKGNSIKKIIEIVWSDIENVLNSALSMSLSSLSRSNKAANVLEWKKVLFSSSLSSRIDSILQKK